MLLTVDRGNSTLDCKLWDDGEGLRRVRLNASDQRGLQRFLAGASVQQVVAVSVVEGGLDLLRQSLPAPQVTEVGVDGCDVPLRIDYDDPDSLGRDRLVGAYAAWRQCGGGVLTVDCGTALTINAVAGDGVFLGGAIAPGLPVLSGGLQHFAPALPVADPQAAMQLPARSSQDAVNLGITLGFCVMLEGLVDAVARHAGLVASPRILTGGAAPIYLRHRAPGRFALVDDLVHRGLRLLAEQE